MSHFLCQRSWILYKRLKKCVPLSSLEHAGSQPQQLFSSQSLWLAQLGEILCVAEHPGKSDWERTSGPLSDQPPDRAAQLMIFRRRVKVNIQTNPRYSWEWRNIIINLLNLTKTVKKGPCPYFNPKIKTMNVTYFAWRKTFFFHCDIIFPFYTSIEFKVYIIVVCL